MARRQPGRGGRWRRERGAEVGETAGRDSSPSLVPRPEFAPPGPVGPHDLIRTATHHHELRPGVSLGPGPLTPRHPPGLTVELGSAGQAGWGSRGVPSPHTKGPRPGPSSAPHSQSHDCRRVPPRPQSTSCPSRSTWILFRRRAWRRLFFLSFFSSFFWFVFSKERKASCRVSPEHMKEACIFHTQLLPASGPAMRGFGKRHQQIPSARPRWRG